MGGGLGSPQKISSLNGVKLCSSRQDKHRNAPPQKPRGWKIFVRILKREMHAEKG